MNHWVILPILFPAVVAPLLALAVRHDIVLARTFSIGSAVILLFIGLLQLTMASDGVVRTYELGNWAAPYGIVLVLDRLAAIMLVLTASIGLLVLLYSIGGWDRRGQHFHPLVQFQLMGLNGAFLTGDLFNLFVFFEVLLIASYGLMVHGGGAARIRAGVQYVVVNLVGSTIFLMGLALIYSVAGTLNLADLYVKASEIPSSNQALFNVGIVLLLIVFGLKSALFPLQFWLPGTYANTAGPIAALFAILTKVGVYAFIRVFNLAAPVFQETQFGSVALNFLLFAALITLMLGSLGVLGAKSLGQQTSFAALASMGLLLLTVADPSPETRAAGLYYLLHSTLTVAAAFMIVDLVIARRPGEGDAFVVGTKLAQQGFIGALFFVVAVALVGLPPLSGFVGKLLILQATAQHAAGIIIWTVILPASLIMIVGFARSGSLIFWKSGSQQDDASETNQHENEISNLSIDFVMPVIAIGSFVFLIFLLTAFGGIIVGYLELTVTQYQDVPTYVDAVLATEGS